jgi:hypothetical protein
MRKRETALETPVRSRYLCRQVSGSFSSIGGSYHEQKATLVLSDVVDFGIPAGRRVDCRACPECSQDDELV